MTLVTVRTRISGQTNQRHDGELLCLQVVAGIQGVKEDATPPNLRLPIGTNLPPSMSLVSISLPTIL